MDILKMGTKVIEKEIEAIEKISKELDENFVSAINSIHDCKGRVIFTGLGKSGHIGKNWLLLLLVRELQLVLSMQQKLFMEI